MKESKRGFYILFILGLILISIPIIYSIYFGFVKGDYFNIMFGYSYTNGIFGFVLTLVKIIPFTFWLYALGIICIVFGSKKIVNYNRKANEKINVKKPVIIIIISYLVFFMIVTLWYKYYDIYIDIPTNEANMVREYLINNYPSNDYEIIKKIDSEKLSSCGGVFNSCEPVNNTKYIIFVAKDKNSKNILKVKYIKYSSGNIKIIDENDKNFIDTSIPEDYEKIEEYNDIEEYDS